MFAQEHASAVTIIRTHTQFLQVKKEVLAIEALLRNSGKIRDEIDGSFNKNFNLSTKDATTKLATLHNAIQTELNGMGSLQEEVGIHTQELWR
jgi:hypothetical protein